MPRTSTLSQPLGAQQARSLSDDCRGILLVIGLIAGAVASAVLFHYSKIGHTLLDAESLQIAADQTALTAAVWHARGMSALTVMNLIMAGIMAVLVCWRLAELILGVIAVVAGILEFIPFFEWAQPIEDWAVSTEERLVSKDEKIVKFVDRSLSIINRVERATVSFTPIVAFSAGLLENITIHKSVPNVSFVGALSVSMVPDLRAEKLLSKVKLLGTVVNLLVPPRMNYSNFLPALPVEAANKNELCGQAAAFVPRVISIFLSLGNAKAAASGANHFGSLTQTFIKQAPQLFCNGDKTDASKGGPAEEAAASAARVKCADKVGAPPPPGETGLPDTYQTEPFQWPPAPVAPPARPPRPRPPRPQGPRPMPGKPSGSGALASALPPGAAAPKPPGQFQDYAPPDSGPSAEAGTPPPKSSYSPPAVTNPPLWDKVPNWARWSKVKRNEYEECIKDEKAKFQRGKPWNSGFDSTNPGGVDPTSSTLWTPTTFFTIFPNAVFFQVYGIAVGQERTPDRDGGGGIVGYEPAKDPDKTQTGFGNAEYYYDCPEFQWSACSFNAMYEPRWRSRIRRAHDPTENPLFPGVFTGAGVDGAYGDNPNGPEPSGVAADIQKAAHIIWGADFNWFKH